MTENEKQEAFDKWYDENYDEWAEGEEGIALREELEQAFKSGIAILEKENAELKHTIAELRREKDILNTHTKAQEKLKKYCGDQLTKAKELLQFVSEYEDMTCYADELGEIKQFLKELEK